MCIIPSRNLQSKLFTMHNVVHIKMNGGELRIIVLVVKRPTWSEIVFGVPRKEDTALHISQALSESGNALSYLIDWDIWSNARILNCSCEY